MKNKTDSRPCVNKYILQLIFLFPQNDDFTNGLNGLNDNNDINDSVEAISGAVLKPSLGLCYSISGAVLKSYLELC